MLATASVTNNDGSINNFDASTSQELWKIIHNGRVFLDALEKFAAVKFPNQDAESAPAFIPGNKRRRGGGVVPAVSARPILVPAAASAFGAHSVNGAPTTAQNNTTQEGVVAEQQPDTGNGTNNNEPAAARPKKPRKRKTTIVRRDIVRYSEITGEITGYFPSTMDAARASAKELNKPESEAAFLANGISKVLHGIIRRTKGYYYHYEDDTATPLPEFPISTSSKHPKTTITRQRRQQQQQQKSTAGSSSALVGSEGSLVRYCAISGIVLGRYKTRIDAARALAAIQAPPNLPPDRRDLFAQQVKNGICRVLAYRQRMYLQEYFRFDYDPRPLPVFPISNTSAHPMDSGTAKGGVVRYCATSGKELARYENEQQAAQAVVKEWSSSDQEESEPPDDAVLAEISRGIGWVLKGQQRTYKEEYFRYANDQRPLPEFPVTDTSRHPMDGGSAKDTPVDIVEGGGAEDRPTNSLDANDAMVPVGTSPRCTN